MMMPNTSASSSENWRALYKAAIGALLKDASTTRPLGERLRWQWVSGPLIQRVREDFVVTYITMSEEEQTAAMQGPEMVLLHPYVSFLVTPKGIVFGGFPGS